MTASSVQINSTGGTRLATNSYTEGGVTVHDEKTIPGEPYLPFYTVSHTTGGVSIATANDHPMQIMAGSSLNVYIRRIRIYQSVVATTAAMTGFAILRLTTAGTGGTAITPQKYDNSDASAGLTAMSLPSSKGTEGSRIWVGYTIVTQTAPTAGISTLLFDLDFDKLTRGKALIIPSGTTNGIAVKILTATAGASVEIDVDASEASF